VFSNVAISIVALSNVGFHCVVVFQGELIRFSLLCDLIVLGGAAKVSLGCSEFSTIYGFRIGTNQA